MNIGTSLRLGYQTQLSLPLPTPASPARTPPPRPVSDAHEAQLVATRDATRESEELAKTLQSQLGDRVRIEIHDNRSTMVSYRRTREGYAIRLHRMFFPPLADFADTLVAFLVGRGRRRAEAGRWLDQFIRAHRDAIRQPRPSRCPPSRGTTHDLKPMFEDLNRRFFDGSVQAEIGWGRVAPKRARRSIKMGVYLHDQRHIRLHPALDRPEVPAYVVEFVVYHEMCHQICPPEKGSGRKQRIHTRAFRERERLHPDRERALLWEKQNLRLLLRGRRESTRPGPTAREYYP